MTILYAIETVGLTKRYPTSRGADRGLHGFRGSSISSLNGVIRVLRGTGGPYTEALRGVDLNIKEGEVFGVLGPNGAGKTTLIKILCTLVIQDEGEAYVHGVDVKRQPRDSLKYLQGVLPESRGFAWRLTGRQNLEFYALLYGLRDDKAKERINGLLELTGLEERADDLYQRYSTGMQRRLLLCRALLRDTPILLFDEPTAGLDPNSAAEFRSLLHDSLARGERKTILLSTHNLYEAQDICDRIAILDRGKITACDTPDNIRRQMIDEMVFNITFTPAAHDEGQNRMIDKLRQTTGVHKATPEVDPEGNLKALEVRADKNVNFSEILDTIIKTSLRIKTINTKEPTLEDAFKAITRQEA